MAQDLKPVSRTAYYCCGVRALDARAERPVCGDGLADRFMTPEAWALFEPFRAFPRPNAANVVRHRMIDDRLRDRLAARPDAGVIVLGAGFDTRAFRLLGGRWVELDEPQVIALKGRQLPSGQAPNPLTRIAIDFETDSLASALQPCSEFERPIVVLEGVLLYLTPEQIRSLMVTLRESLRQPTLICDLMTLDFVRRYSGSMREALGKLGARFAHHDRDPKELIEEAGFHLTERESIAGRAGALGVFHPPRWLLATLFRVLRDGYSIGTFEATPGVSP
ncbi:MAG: class I SAM-dependent methyltransferase [Gemmatimonadales bacterium]